MQRVVICYYYYLLCCLHCPRFSQQEALLAGSSARLSCARPIHCVFLAEHAVPGSSCTLPHLVLESAISLGSPVWFLLLLFIFVKDGI